MLEQELDVFYAEGEFASRFTRVGTLGEVLGIFSVVDQEALDGYALSAQYELRYPTAAIELHAGDVLATEQDGIKGRYSVRAQPQRVVDGLESSVLLTKLAEPEADHA